MDINPFYEPASLDRPFPFLAWDSFKAPFWFPMHWHERVEILYILKGKFLAYINEARCDGNQGDIIIVNPGFVHGFFDPSPDTLARIFQFGLDIFDETLTELHDRDFPGPVFSRQSLITSSRDSGIHTLLEKLLKEMFEEYQKKIPGYRLVIKSKLYELSALFLREVATEKASPEKITNKKNATQYLEHIFSLMLENYDNPDFSLEDAAHDIGLSKYHFSRLLKEQTGQGFHDHFARIRLRQAEKFLVESGQSVTDIAYNCGFQSLTTFNRLFKTYTGTSPSAYRSGKNVFLPSDK
jgi:AraC-like DNA-binding protein